MQHYMVLHAGGDTTADATRNLEDLLTDNQGWWPNGGPAVFVLNGHVNLVQVIYKTDDVQPQDGAAAINKRFWDQFT